MAPLTFRLNLRLQYLTRMSPQNILLQCLKKLQNFDVSPDGCTRNIIFNSRIGLTTRCVDIIRAFLVQIDKELGEYSDFRGNVCEVSCLLQPPQ